MRAEARCAVPPLARLAVLRWPCSRPAAGEASDALPDRGRSPTASGSTARSTMPSSPGAELPLIERGAELRGDPRAAASTRRRGRRARRSSSCPAAPRLWEFSTLTAETRRLIEREHVDAIVGAGSGADEVVLRDVARLYPDVIFVALAHGPREVTLRGPPPNLFRFARRPRPGRRRAWAPTPTASSAGAGPRSCSSTGTRAGGRGTHSSAEFCALGGRVGTTSWPSNEFDPAGGDVAASRAASTASPCSCPRPSTRTASSKRLARSLRRPGPPAPARPRGRRRPDPAARRPAGALDGVVGSSYVDPAPGCGGYLRRLRAGVSRAPPPTSPAANRSAAIATRSRRCWPALEARRRELGRALPCALGARLRVDLLGGPVAAGPNRQAVDLDQPGAGRARGERGRRASRRCGPGVDQSIGGLCSAALPRARRHGAARDSAALGAAAAQPRDRPGEAGVARAGSEAAGAQAPPDQQRRHPGRRSPARCARCPAPRGASAR